MQATLIDAGIGSPPLRLRRVTVTIPWDWDMAWATVAGLCGLAALLKIVHSAVKAIHADVQERWRRAVRIGVQQEISNIIAIREAVDGISNKLDAHAGMLTSHAGDDVRNFGTVATGQQAVMEALQEIREQQLVMATNVNWLIDLEKQRGKHS